MLVVLNKYKVTVKFVDREVIVWVHDAHIENALRKVADLSFSANGLEQPIQITIGK